MPLKSRLQFPRIPLELLLVEGIHDTSLTSGLLGMVLKMPAMSSTLGTFETRRRDFSEP